MTKSQLIDAIHANAGEGLSRKAVGEIVDATFDGIVTSLKSGTDKFQIPGFGTFQVKERKARVGRNPRTGEELKIPASKAVTFKVAAGLKREL